MTEQEWLDCSDPQAMLEFLRRKASDRKLQLFCCACGLGNEFVQGDDEYRAAFLETQDWVDEPNHPVPTFWGRQGGKWWPKIPFDWAKAFSKDDDPDELTFRTKADMLRCVFGPLGFRAITFDASWRTPTATKLAASIYSERTFDHLPLLADALEEARCTQADILNHCRSEGPHVRGCWVVDLILRKQ